MSLEVVLGELTRARSLAFEAADSLEVREHVLRVRSSNSPFLCAAYNDAPRSTARPIPQWCLMAQDHELAGIARTIKARQVIEKRRRFLWCGDRGCRSGSRKPCPGKGESMPHESGEASRASRNKACA